MAFELPKLPYAMDALQPHISKETLEYHYGKHHKAYVDKLNAALPGSEFEGKSLEEIIAKSSGGVFNNAAQVWNHTFYWHSMKPGGGGEPTGDVADAINKSFGSFAKFKEEFTNAAATQFGSGWAWLAIDNGKLVVTKSANASNPLVDGMKPILGCDVWEHSYYIDYRNKRPDYLKAFLDNLVNWEYVASQL